MLMCSICKKRPAVVFITQMQGNEKKNVGMCFACAKEHKIPQVSEYMERLGITDEEIENLSDHMMEMLDGDSFEMGGSGIMPDFLSNMMNGIADMSEESEKSDDKSPRRNPFEGLFGSRENREKNKERSKEKKNDRKLKFLNSYCTNLSQKAADGKLDNIIGRDKEIARVVQILSRRTKNNPCLIGEPGVGKTAIAEGIAQRINEGNVPF
ncbi:MAG: ATP-dependent Clp protease ATP-binding subunit, partial [Ruminococcus sp.]|nr:ATP-dependent Clp protease ATP-binding subunit [Ruminococcus sp.]